MGDIDSIFQHQEQRLAAMTARAEAAEAQCAAMRQCLERWVGSSAFEYMPEPGTLVYDTDAALATDAGAKMLAKVERLRWLETFIRYRRTTGEGDDGWAASIDYALGKLDAGEVTDASAE